MFDVLVYRQTDVTSPAIGNLFITYLKRIAIENATLKPKLWLQYGNVPNQVHYRNNKYCGLAIKQE